MAKSTFDRRTASFADSLPVMNSFSRGASRNMYSGVTTFCRFASAWGSFLAAPSTGLGAATLVMGSPCGFVFCSASSASLIVTPLGYIARAVQPCSAFTLHLLGRMAEGSYAGKSGHRRKGEGIGVRFPTVNSRLRAGKSYVLAVLRQLNTHFFAHSLEDL